MDGSAFTDNLTFVDNITNNTFSSKYPDHEYYDLSYRIIGTIIMSIIFAVGFIGNLMVVIVVFRSKSMHSPTNCYLVSLAIADLLLLLSATLPTITEFHLIVDEFAAGTVACSTMVFVQYLGFNLSSMSITALTAERYIAICKPMKAQLLCSVGRAKRIIAALWLFGFCYSAPWLGLSHTRVKPNSYLEECTFRLQRKYYLVYYLTDLVVMYLIPVLVNVILYALISRSLYRSNPMAAAFNVVAAAATSCRSETTENLRGDFKTSETSSLKYVASDHKESQNGPKFQSQITEERKLIWPLKNKNEGLRSFNLESSIKNFSQSEDADRTRRRFVTNRNKLFRSDVFLNLKQRNKFNKTNLHAFNYSTNLKNKSMSGDVKSDILMLEELNAAEQLKEKKEKRNPHDDFAKLQEDFTNQSRDDHLISFNRDAFVVNHAEEARSNNEKSKTPSTNTMNHTYSMTSDCSMHGSMRSLSSSIKFINAGSKLMSMSSSINSNKFNHGTTLHSRMQITLDKKALTNVSKVEAVKSLIKNILEKINRI